MNWLYLINRMGSEFSVWYVSFLWHSLLIVAVMSLVLFIYRRYSARVKCLVWVISIPMMLVMPTMSGLAIKSSMPVYEIGVLPVTPAEIPQTVHRVDMGIERSVTSPHSATLLQHPHALFFVAYGLAVLCMAGFFLAGRRKISRLILRSTPILDTSFNELLERCSQNLNISRRVLVLESDEVPVPFTIGLLHPVIVLPSGLFSRIPADEQQHVLLHELAHIKRFDSPVLTITAIGRALLFLNPFVWFAVSRISPLAEEACDELVVEHYGEPVQYARTLTSIAETIRDKSFGLEYAAGFVFSRRVFLRRIESILSMRTRIIAKLSRRAATGLVILMGILALSVVAFPVTSRAVNTDSNTSTENEKLMSLWLKAPTQEKQDAIMRIIGNYKRYRRHTAAAERCAELILTANRNINVIWKLSEYGISVPYHTMGFIEVAEYAAKAPLADNEFIEIAELIKTRLSETGRYVKLAKQASQAQNEKELEKVRRDIEKVKGEPSLGNSFSISLLTMTANLMSSMSSSFNPQKELEMKKDQAQTSEKREEIEKIRKLFEKHKQNFLAMRCVDLILDADRNVPVIGKLAEYAITEGSNTLAYVGIAEYAAKAPVAGDEFVQIAELARTHQSGTGRFIDLARQAAEARNEEELGKVRRQIQQY